MTNYLTVRLAPWAMERITRDYLTSTPAGPGKAPRIRKMSKVALRASLADFPDTEFSSDRGYLTTREAKAQGIDVLEVRFNGDRDLAMIDLATGRVS